MKTDPYILKCYYITETDVGDFESLAKVDVKTGHVFDIEDATTSDDGESAENVNNVYVERIVVTFKDASQSFEVNFATHDDYYVIPHDLSLLQDLAKEIHSDLLKTKLETTIKSKSEQPTIKPKI